MKNILSALFVLIAINACSAAPNADSSTASSSLDGTWVAPDDASQVIAIFSGNTAQLSQGIGIDGTLGFDQLTLNNPSSVVLGGNTYTVYLNASDRRLYPYRFSGDQLFSAPTGTSIANLEERFNGVNVSDRGGFLEANRKK
ncbi:MAG: hypothetical protein ACRCY4_10640 [Brevinema sp.]